MVVIKLLLLSKMFLYKNILDIFKPQQFHVTFILNFDCKRDNLICYTDVFSSGAPGLTSLVESFDLICVLTFL